MIKLTVNDELEVKLPTSIEEISNEYLESVAEEINVADYHTLIALITVSKLEDIAFSCVSDKNKNGLTAAVIPVFVKHGFGESKFNNSISTGDKLLISRTAIEMSDHVRLSNNLITPGSIADYLRIDNNLRLSIINKSFFGDIKNTPKIYMVEFKVVPDSEIHGFYTKLCGLINPFVNKINK